MSGVWSSIKKGVKSVGKGVTSTVKKVGKGVSSAAKTVGKGVVSAATKTGSVVKRAVVGREAYKLQYPGLTWADKVVINRAKVTPSRLILDAFYQMMNSYLNL